MTRQSPTHQSTTTIMPQTPTGRSFQKQKQQNESKQPKQQNQPKKLHISATVLIIAFLTTLLLTLTTASVSPNPHNVATLTKENYKQYLLRPTMVFFTTRGCKLCDQNLLEFEKSNQLLQSDQDLHYSTTGERSSKDTRFAVVNCSDRGEEGGEGICHDYHIEGFPTILAIHYPRYFEEYKGPRTPHAIYRFYRQTFIQQVFPPLTTVQQYEEYIGSGLGPDYIKAVVKMPPQAYMKGDKFEPYRRLKVLLNDKLIVLAHDRQESGQVGTYNTTTAIGLKPIGGDDSLWDLTQVGDDSFYFEIYRDFSSHYTKPSSNPNDINVKSDKNLSGIDKSPIRLEIRSTKDVLRISSLWDRSLVPLFGSITASNYNNYLSLDMPIIWAFYDKFQNGAETGKVSQMITKEVNNILPQIAEQFYDSLLFVGMDSRQFGRHAINFGLAQDSGATVVGYETKKGTNGENEPIFGLVLEDRTTRKNYIFPSSAIPLTTTTISKWLNDYLDANPTLAPIQRSEDESVFDDGTEEKNDKKGTDDAKEVPHNSKSSLQSTLHTIIGSKLQSYLINQVSTQQNDVVMMFYTSWCGIAPYLREILNEIMRVGAVGVGVGENNTNNFSKSQSSSKSNQITIQDNKIRFAQIDTSLNDTPGLPEINETPVLYLFKAGSVKGIDAKSAMGKSLDAKIEKSANFDSQFEIIKEPLKFTQEIDILNVLEWVLQNATVQPPQQQDSDNKGNDSKRSGYKHDEL